MFELILWPEAEQDIAEAQQWYEGRREGLGDDFEACLDEAFEKLIQYPTVFGFVYSGLRRFQVRRFPDGIYFDVIDESVVVVAVFHGRQDLGRIGTRLRNHN